LTYVPTADGKTAARKTAEPGDYLVILEVDGLKLTRRAVVRPMPEKGDPL